MQRILAWSFLFSVIAVLGALFGARSWNAHNANATVIAPQLMATQTAAASRPPVSSWKAGMVIDGATVLKTADLIVDWKKWLGQDVIIRGTAFGADDTHVAFDSANVMLKLGRMDSETKRWFLRECYQAFVNPDCNGITISAVPEDGPYSRELVNVRIMR
jgi:hypothetical protein